MKICPYCDAENPRHRILCLRCGMPLEPQTRSRGIAGLLGWIVCGLALIFLDIVTILKIAHFIPVPYALGFIGMGVILYNAEGLINIYEHGRDEESIQPELGDHSPLVAPVLGLAAGVMAGSLWYLMQELTHTHSAVFALLVGWAVGKFTLIGAREKHSRALQVSSLLTTLLIFAALWHFIVRSMLVKGLANAGSPGGIALFLTPELAWRLASAVVGSAPVILLFMALGLLLAYWIPGGLYINKPDTSENRGILGEDRRQG